MPTDQVRGIGVDTQTRCAHWHSSRDVIAIRMACCGEYYACRECHDALADHQAAVWPQSSWDTKSVLCGVCSTELTIHEYKACDFRCPHCAAEFNPGCAKHYGLYFEIG